MAIDLDVLLIQVVVNIVVLAPVLWLAGRTLVGADKAKFLDAIWIVVLGTVISAVFNALFNYGFVAAIILFIILLGLVKHFFDCGWVQAFIIAVLAAIIFVVIIFILTIIGIGILALI